MALCVALTGAVLGAQQRNPWPAFELQQAGGPVSSESVVGTDRALVVFVRPNCRPCDSLIGALAKWATPELVARTVLVVHGDAATAQSYVTATVPEALSGVRWYADPQGGGFAALDFRGAPVLVGVEKREIDWTLAGVLARPDVLETVVRRWVEGPQ